MNNMNARKDDKAELVDFRVENVAAFAADDTGWEPMVVNDKEIGEVKWLRREEGDRLLLVGLWRAQFDFTYDYVFEAEESYLVIEGEQRLEFDSGRVAVTGPGDAATFQAGRSCKGSVSAPFLEFFVMSS